MQHKDLKIQIEHEIIKLCPRHGHDCDPATASLPESNIHGLQICSLASIQYCPNNRAKVFFWMITRFHNLPFATLCPCHYDDCCELFLAVSMNEQTLTATFLLCCFSSEPIIANVILQYWKYFFVYKLQLETNIWAPAHGHIFSVMIELWRVMVQQIHEII